MRRLALVLAVLLLGVRAAPALDSTILGSQLLVRDPKPGVDATRRRIVAKGNEKASTDALLGSPDASGATVTVFATGATSTSQSFVLPPGTDPATGKPYWTISATRLRYKDQKGSAGPVRLAELKRSSRGTFQIRVVVAGRHGPIDVVPPNPGTSGCVRLDLDGGAVTYHVLLPPAPDATVKKDDEKIFLVKNAILEGTCPTTTTTTTLPPVCGNGVHEPGEYCDGEPFCTPNCFLDIPACCSTATQCVDVAGYSLESEIFLQCDQALPGWTNVLPGGICQPDGSCATEAIAPPLDVCCQHAASCEDDAVADTHDLYNFDSACQGPETGTLVLGAQCSAGGTCIAN
jgi:hypothetical protein